MWHARRPKLYHRALQAVREEKSLAFALMHSKNVITKSHAQEFKLVA